MRHSERGNAMFYILIAVALLAALVFAVAQSSRTSATALTEEQQRLLATEILDYSQSVKNAVAQLRLRGTSFVQLSFAKPGDAGYNTTPAHEIFNTQGGGIVYQDVRPEAQIAATAWVFAANNEIDDVGTTCAAAGCVDLLMILPAVRRDTCIKINDFLGITGPTDEPPLDSSIDTLTPFTGTPTYDDTIGDEAGSTEVRGKQAGCVKETAPPGEYHFYQVLEAR